MNGPLANSTSGLDSGTRQALKTLSSLAQSRGQDIWLVGGGVRDLLLGNRPLDLDLAASGDALALGRELAAKLATRFVPLKEKLASCRVTLGRGAFLDITGLRASSLQGDLLARDFTINALALELHGFLQGDPQIIDPTGGQEDLAKKLIRLAGPGVLRVDPLRVLRAYRFMSTLGFALAPSLPAGLNAAGPGLFRIPAERIGVEWLKLMAGKRVFPAVLAMERDQVLTRLLPVLAMGRGVEQNPYHHLDVFWHNLACLKALERLYQDPYSMLSPQLGREADAYLQPQQRRALVMTAALLHDTGKPVTRRQTAPEWSTFYCHDLQGADLAARACRSLGLSKASASFIAKLVGGHMRPFHLMGAESRQALGKRGVRRLISAVDQDLPGIFIMAMADTMAGKGPQRPPEAEERLLRLYAKVADLRDRELAQALAAPPLLNGTELMRALDIPPGPLVGRLLSQIREAQLDGEISSKDGALELAASILDKARGEGPPRGGQVD